jgi:hypothetical protein
MNIMRYRMAMTGNPLWTHSEFADGHQQMPSGFAAEGQDISLIS